MVNMGHLGHCCVRGVVCEILHSVGKCPFQSKRAAVEAMQKVAIGALIVKSIAPLAVVALPCMQLGLVATFLKALHRTRSIATWK